MLVVGLTGSIGMGKSTVAGRFRDRGIPVCDADAEVHRLYSGAAVPLIEAAFPGTTGPEGVDRTRLSAALLDAPDRFGELEAIIHPLVQRAEADFLAAAHARDAALAVLEIPLLFETGGDERCDTTIVVSAPADVQRRRVLERPGMTTEKLAQILARQTPDAEKRARAEFVVDTSGTFEDTYAQVDTIIESLRGRKGVAFVRHWASLAQNPN